MSAAGPDIIAAAGTDRIAHTEGSLRVDVTADDIALLLIGLGRITEVTDGSAPGGWQRQLDLVLDGLRASSTTNTTETSTALAHNTQT